MLSGYSQTPLAKKLGIKEGFTALFINEPKHYFQLFEDLPVNLEYIERPTAGQVDFIHLFCIDHATMVAHAKMCKEALKKTGTLWVSWPKGSSQISTDLKREPIREHLLSLGLVDTKVAAIDKDWSGLKFVYRLKDRK